MRNNRSGLLLLVLVAMSCSDGTDEDGGNGGGLGATADMRVVGALQSATTIHVIVDGDSLFAVAPGGVSATLPVPVGNRTVTLAPSGGTAIGSTWVMHFDEGQRYLLAASDSAGIAVPHVYGDTNAIPVAGKSKLRVIHAAGLAPPVDIWRTQPDFPTLIRVMFPFAFGAESPYLLSDPGDWSIVVTPEGQTDTLYATGSFTVGAGKLVTVVVMDSTASGGVSAVVVPDN